MISPRPNPTKTPGILYFIRFLNGTFQVVPISTGQGLRMRERGVKHVYDSATQAYTIAKRLEKVKPI